MANDTSHRDVPDSFTWTSILLNHGDVVRGNDSVNEPESPFVANVDNGGDYSDYFIGGSGDDGEIASNFLADTDNSTELPQVFVSEIGQTLNTTTTNANENLTTFYNQITDSSWLLHNGTINATTDGDNDTTAAAKIQNEGGSNFMLLFEDFGEYFYNYNGTGFNESSISTLPNNCSLTNTSCPDSTNGKYLSLSLTFNLFYFRSNRYNLMIPFALCYTRSINPRALYPLDSDCVTATTKNLCTQNICGEKRVLSLFLYIF